MHASEVGINKAVPITITLHQEQKMTNFLFHLFLLWGNADTTVSTHVEVKGKHLAVDLPILLCGPMHQTQVLEYNKQHLYPLNSLASHFADKHS